MWATTNTRARGFVVPHPGWPSAEMMLHQMYASNRIPRYAPHPAPRHPLPVAEMAQQILQQPAAAAGGPERRHSVNDTLRTDRRHLRRQIRQHLKRLLIYMVMTWRIRSLARQDEAVRIQSTTAMRSDGAHVTGKFQGNDRKVPAMQVTGTCLVTTSAGQTSVTTDESAKAEVATGLFTSREKADGNAEENNCGEAIAETTRFRLTEANAQRADAIAPCETLAARLCQGPIESSVITVEGIAESRAARLAAKLKAIEEGVALYRKQQVSKPVCSAPEPPWSRCGHGYKSWLGK